MASSTGALPSDAAALRATGPRTQFLPGLKTRGSLQDQAELSTVASWLRGFDYLYAELEVSERALDVQREAINKGFHRALSWPDLLIAATAERYGAVVLHHDADYDMIASLTRQHCQWVVEPSTAD